MAVTIAYSITFDDYREGNRLMCLNTTSSRRRNYRFVTSLWPIFFVVMLATGIVLVREKGATPGPAVATFALAALSLWAPWHYRRSIRRAYKLQRLGASLTATLDDAGIALRRDDGTSESRTAWSRIEGHAASQQVLALFPSGMTFIPIPLRALSSEQKAELSALIAAHVPGASS